MTTKTEGPDGDLIRKDDAAYHAAQGVLFMMLGSSFDTDRRHELAAQCAAPTPYTAGMHPIAYAAGIATATARRLLENEPERLTWLDAWRGRYDGDY